MIVPVNVDGVRTVALRYGSSMKSISWAGGMSAGWGTAGSRVSDRRVRRRGRAGPGDLGREAYGPAAGFLFGWALLLVVQSGTIAAVGVAFANFLGVLVPWISGSRYLVEPIAFGRYAVSLSTQQLTAVSMILLLTTVGVVGFGEKLSYPEVAGLLLALASLVLLVRFA